MTRLTFNEENMLNLLMGLKTETRRPLKNNAGISELRCGSDERRNVWIYQGQAWCHVEQIYPRAPIAAVWSSERRYMLGDMVLAVLPDKRHLATLCIEYLYVERLSDVRKMSIIREGFDVNSDRFCEYFRNLYGESPDWNPPVVVIGFQLVHVSDTAFDWNKCLPRQGVPRLSNTKYEIIEDWLVKEK